MHAKIFFHCSQIIPRALEDYISAPVMLPLNFAEKYMRNIGTFIKKYRGKLGALKKEI